VSVAVKHVTVSQLLTVSVSPPKCQCISAINCQVCRVHHY